MKCLKEYLVVSMSNNITITTATLLLVIIILGRKAEWRQGEQLN